MRNVISLLLAHPELTDISFGFTVVGQAPSNGQL